MDPVNLAARAEAIRLPSIEIARRSELDKDTVHKVLNGKSDARHSTLTRIGDVVAAEELALRDHLLRLHPLEEASPSDRREAA